MPKKTQCETHSEEIKELRRVKHSNANDITKLSLEHEQNKGDISEIKDDIYSIKKNHLEHIEKDISAMKTDIGWLKESYKKLDKKFWAILLMTLGTLLTTVINFLT